jgi:hypothetical protein
MRLSDKTLHTVFPDPRFFRSASFRSPRLLPVVRDVAISPHFLTSLAVLSLRSLKTARDVTLETLSVTSPSKNGIKHSES